MEPQNIIGPNVSRLRAQQGWTQEELATKLQCEGVDISRLSVARIEYRIIKVNDTVLGGLQRVFRIPIIKFFPKHIQDSDATFAQRVPAPLPEPDSDPPKKPRRKCQKLTKRGKAG
jgi:transcriptional regulator with XRE-family HTH domain